MRLVQWRVREVCLPLPYYSTCLPASLVLFFMTYSGRNWKKFGSRGNSLNIEPGPRAEILILTYGCLLGTSSR